MALKIVVVAVVEMAPVVFVVVVAVLVQEDLRLRSIIDLASSLSLACSVLLGTRNK